MTSRRFWAAGAVAFIASLAMGMNSAQAGYIDIGFDDLAATGSDALPVPAGYQGFAWSNFYYLTTATYFLNPSGYLNGTFSPPNVGFNGFAEPASFSLSHPFTLYGVYLTAAWNDGLSVTVNGYSDAAGTMLADTQTFTANTEGPMLAALNWSGIEDVLFTTSGGVHNPALPGNGTHVAIDDIELNVSTVPLPAALPLFGVGLLGLGALGWMGKRHDIA
jgi:hypothetical protein